MEVRSHELGLDQVRLENALPESDGECSSKDKPHAYHLAPPESVDASIIYRLYRGTTGEVQNQHRRIWVEFPALQLCWAAYDKPAQPPNRLSLLDLASCSCYTSSPSNGQVVGGSADGELACMEIWGLGNEEDPGVSSSANTSARSQLMAALDAGSEEVAVEGRLGQPRRQAEEPFVGRGYRETAGQPQVPSVSPSKVPLLTFESSSMAIRDFAEALQKLLASRDREGKGGLEFIQRALFQYLWRHQGVRLAENSEQALYEAQAVLAFNLDPKEGVKYLKGKLGKSSDVEVGEWLAEMSTLNGGLDPTLLGNYFSRMDTIEVFKAFVRCLDFQGMDLVVALRKLFDTFKPGGEGQVISRIIELFAETYFAQWSQSKESTEPKTAYVAPDSVMATAFSIIMLNTGLHVASKKVNKKGPINAAAMTPEEFVENTRRVVGEEEVPEEALVMFYNAVKEAEISMQPMPRVAFSRLPVQPDIEGWLTVVLSTHDQRRYWGVLALQRLYLFSDNSDVDPADACDLKDASAQSILDDVDSRERFTSNLMGKTKCLCFAR
eukprot:CAMPEP_0197696106 /NCGR_PEP_ID=MMETSP1338-20131121/116140_1 /TAXON_ID=43686 ORGANISM="Pelagodinium beii, Strain RCC1491" /NCGR_SAMPLE_ID=MMETSP1338 /ASSEMBLY_ACC=CAM_ASM_000754 /LENGTH=551 /DNA_ID=CAMNT_0043279171 /DNA_START=34 /DNA_END=1686 /DNA_ORIENTATION=-